MNRNTAILSLLLALTLTLSGCGKTQPAPALSGQDSAPSSQNSVGGAASEPAVTPDIRPAGPGVEAAGTPAETAGELVFTMDYDLGLLDGSGESGWFVASWLAKGYGTRYYAVCPATGQVIQGEEGAPVVLCGQGLVRFVWKDADGNEVAAADGAGGTVRIPNARLWWPWPGEPYLYTASVTYGEDLYEETFGIRTVAVEGTQFLINGKPFYFKGFGKHEDAAFRGRGLDVCLDVKDINLIHWLNANSFRTSHYPYAEEMYQLCDREGIVVIDETPAVGIGAGDKIDPYKTFHIREHHEQVLREMIARDKNHPCVVMWSMGNEPDTEHFPESAYDYWHSLYELTHSIDPADRPVTFVCCQNNYERDLVTRTMDVVCVNRYYGWYNLSGDLDAACYALNMELDFWEKQNKPVMITEYGADAVAGIHESVPEMFSEEFQMEYYRRQNAEFDKRSFFIGEQVWNFADFATIQGCMRADGNKKGLFTRDRRPKMAAHYFKERWGQIPNFEYK